MRAAKKCSKRSILASVVAFALVVLSGSAAEAKFTNDGGGKSGPVMLNIKFGVAANAKDYVDQFALQLDFGIAVYPGWDKLRRGPEVAVYLIFPLQFGFGGSVAFGPTFTTIMVPFGVQVDIPIRPVPGLYLYPRFSLGYAAIIGGGVTQSGGVATPVFGAKYVFKKRFNFGFEPFGLPIIFTKNDFTGNIGAAVQYNLLWYGGFNF